MAWIDSSGPKVHTLFQNLFTVGSALMRVEDHLTMGIPGADDELEGVKLILRSMLERVEELTAEVKEEAHA